MSVGGGNEEAASESSGCARKQGSCRRQHASRRLHDVPATCRLLQQSVESTANDVEANQCRPLTLVFPAVSSTSLSGSTWPSLSGGRGSL
jgi:hypothetical protein